MRIILIGLLFFTLSASAQSPKEYFNRAANEYIYKNDQVALNTITSGLSQYPNDANLKKLKDKIEKDKKDQEDQKQKEQQEQEQKDQEQQEQQDNQNQDQEQQEKDQQQEQGEQSEDEEDAEQKDESDQAKPDDTDEEGKEMDRPPQSSGEKLEEYNLTEEKAKMILEAMKNNEIQYIQQNKRKATKRPDSDKPDW